MWFIDSSVLPFFNSPVIFINCSAFDDFVLNGSVRLVFTAATTTQCVNVSIVDDDELESIESFSATLTPDGTLPDGVRLMPSQADVSILDNEGENTSITTDFSAY